MKKWIVFYGLLLTGGALGLESITRKPSVTAQEVLSWISERNGSSLNSVEALLERLPIQYRSHFVLQYKSFSNHSANGTHPRVIFFGPDAKLLLAFSGLPSDPHYNTIEMIEYQPVTASFSFYSVHFFPGAPAKVDVNPQDCKRCHGKDPKPNWEPYSLWPGAFGSLHDRIPNGTVEHSWFESFLKNYSSSSRYKYLPTPFYVENKTLEGSADYYLVNSGASPNSSLSILLGFLNRDRIVKKLVSSSWHSFYRPALTAAMLNCSNPIEDFIPRSFRPSHTESFGDTLSETKRFIAKDFSRKLRTLVQDLKTTKEFILSHANRYGLREPEIERIAKLRYLIQKRKDGLEFDRWALSVSKTSLDFNDGVGGLENLLGHYLKLAYEPEHPLLKANILKQVPFFFTSLEPSRLEPYIIDTFSLVGNTNSACQLLLQEAQTLSVRN